MKLMANDLSEEFPIWGLVPKKETGVLNFLTKYPNYDGRDTVIAILDSGVDPAAPGLSVTSTGQTKVIERFDCSGAGDVNISTVVNDTTGIIQGLTGRNLKIPSTWNNPSKEYHIGIKNAYSLYPDKLRERIEEDNKEKNWKPQHQSALAEATRKLSEFESKHTNAQLSSKDKLEKEDLEARIDILTNYDKKYHDSGPTYDCVVFFDGETWWACIDTTDDGDLSKVKLLGEYSKTHDHRYLTEDDQFTISINIHNNGNILEIVGMCSPHGTHVASITSAYFPDNPEKNGVAPGAQIISLTIGDARLQSMETGTALVRAIIKLMELTKKYSVKVVNMSYGEHAHWSNSGRIGELMNEIVNTYGIIWVASAGNHGPALCTVGAPPDISQPTIIGVGAYVSPEMMIAEYSLRQKLPGMPFTWSSCGPTMDGHNGVSICAPGAAITSVSMYTLRSAQLMNGTSMSAPHVAGAVSILLSGLKQLDIPYSPYSVKRTLENTAQVLSDTERFAQGYGLLQVDRAFESLITNHECPCRDMRLDILVNGTDKGILLRNGLLDRCKDYNIIVTPFFLDNPSITPAIKTSFSVRLALTSSENSQHIKFPQYLDLANMQRAFSVQIDPSGLKPGVYYSTINGYDVSCLEKGPLLRIPVTIIKPLELLDPIYKPQLEWNDQLFVPNTIRRIFVKVPEHATWATLRFKPDEKNKLERFVIHTMQIQPKLSCKVLESQGYWNISALSENVHNFKVKGGLILEVTIAKYWASIGDVKLSYTLTFQGVKPNNSSIVMHGADGITMLQLRTMRNEEILPVVTLKNSVHPLRPVESKINVLTNRDIILPERQIYELVLTYNFHVSKQTEVLPNCCILSDMLYESEFESQLWFIYDSNKQLMAVGDAYPSKYTPKLEKGDYTLKLQIRHDKKDLLESYTDLPMSISQKLSNSITLDVYSSKTLALLHGKKIASATCPPGQIYPIYISALSTEKTSKISNCGQYLSGVITFAKDEVGKKVDTYSFRYILPEPTKKNNGKPVDKEKTKHEEYLDALRDLRVSWLAKLEGSPEAYKLYAQMKEEHLNHCTIHTSMLQSIDAFDTKRQAPSLPISSLEFTNEEIQLFDKIDTICDELISSIDQSKLLAYYGMKSDNRDDAAKIKPEMDRQKNAIIEAYARKGIVLFKQYCNLPDNEKNPAILEKIKAIWDDILKYVEPTDSKVIFFSMWHAAVLGHFGRLLKYMLKYAEDKSSKELDQKILTVLETLNWNHAVRHVQRSIHTKFPPAYSIF